MELGCGASGLVGLAMSPKVTRYLLTDQAYVMRLLKKNIDINQQPAKGSSRRKTPQGQQDTSVTGLEILTLDWERDSVVNVQNALGRANGLDLLVACDCIYNEHLIRPFVQTCIDICSLRSGIERTTFLLVAQQLRSDAVFMEWLQEMLNSFMVWRLPNDLLSRELMEGSYYVVHLAMPRSQSDGQAQKQPT